MACFQAIFRSFFRHHLLTEAYASHLPDTFSQRPIAATFLKIPILPSVLGFPGGLVIKNSPTNAGDAGDAVLIPGSGRLLEEERATHSGILAWRFPWTEKPDWLESMGLQRVRQSWVCTHLLLTLLTQFLSHLPLSHSTHLTDYVRVAQSCLTLCDSMDYTVHGTFQARTLEWALLQGIFLAQQHFNYLLVYSLFLQSSIRDRIFSFFIQHWVLMAKKSARCIDSSQKIFVRWMNEWMSIMKKLVVSRYQEESPWCFWREEHIL